MEIENPEEEISIDKSVFKEWLEKLQQESWQLELLISGFAIFGIYSARPFLNELEISQSLYFSDTTGFVFKSIVNVLKNGWYIFFINLIVHVVFRGLWIGAIGLRYVSSEIEYNKLGYSAKFTSYLKNKVGSYDDFIERLEKLCSVIFAYTFLLFLFFFSFSLFIIEVALIAILMGSLLGPTAPLTSIILFIFLALGLIVFIDFITVGGFKKIKDKSVSRVYFWIYWFYSTITLSNLYRPLLYNFIDNSYTRRLFYLSIPYIIFILFGSSLITNNPLPYLPADQTMSKYGIMINDENYDDRRTLMLNEYPNEDRRIKRSRVPDISLESFEVKNDVLACFVVIEKSFEELFVRDSIGTPYYADGISLRLFGMHKEDDEKYENYRSELGEGLSDKYQRLRELKKIIRKNGPDENLNKEIDQLKIDINSIERNRAEKLKQYDKNKARASLQNYLKYIKFEIDDSPIITKTCYYYRHPNFSELGIKCFIELDSLNRGFHDFTVHKNYLVSDTIGTKTITLPFLKIN